jgi:glycerol-3-phosphate dehydrogenase
MESNWNAKNRSEHIARAGKREFDLLIVGGGINGAGLAREASLRGLSFCLVDKSDFASGTSSRSSKLAHGGIRYIANGELGLVRESETERNWLRSAFPNLVRPTGFVYCAFESGKDKAFLIRIALTMYDILSDWGSKFKNFRKPRYLKPSFLEEFEPEFTRHDKDLGKPRMAGFYYDTNVDDARLTVETIKESLSRSPESVALNYAKVDDFVRGADGKACGAKVRDELGGAAFEVKAKAVAVCVGIWNDEVMKRAGVKEERIYPTKGVHVVVENARLGNRNCFGIRSFDDGRFFFILRRGKYSVIGTTDTDYYKESRNLEEPWCTKADCDYLLNTVNRLFPHARLTYKDIVGTYAGIRPLIKQVGAKSESAVSREHEIFESPEGVFAIAGGKLTTYRLMAEELLFRMREKGALAAFSRPEYCKKGYSKQAFAVGMTREEFDAELQARGLGATASPDQLEHLHRQYGRQALEILAAVEAEPESGAPLVEGYPLSAAEVRFILAHEMAPRLSDVLCHRTEAQWQVWHYRQAELAGKVGGIMAAFYGWDGATEKAEVGRYLEYVRKTIWF